LSNQINPEMLLSITVDEWVDIRIVMHYLKLTSDGIKQEPELWKPDYEMCIEMLKKVTVNIAKRHGCGIIDVSL
jgi:hypothetical protein